MTERTSNILKRYTSLAVAIDMLAEQRLTLMSPSHWQDKNDVYFMETYRARRRLANVFAVCFTQVAETYHHWSVFAGGNDGVRVNIDKAALLTSLADDRRYSWGTVGYKKLDQMERLRRISVYDLPFLKRFAFSDEEEFRLLFDSDDAEAAYHHVHLDRKWIKSITISPWLPENLANSLKLALKSLPGCQEVKITKTSLRDNAQWKGATDRVVHESEEIGSPHRTE